MMRRIRQGAIALAVVGGLAFADRADAFCGFYVSGGDAKLFNNATQVVMMREGTKTVLSMANNYEGPAANFAMVVPVPVILQKENVKTLPRELFDKIDQLDAPRLVEYWEQDPCPPPMRYEAVAEGNAGPVPAAPAATVPGGGNLGVKIEAQFTVGEYEIVILSARDAGGLDKWLKQEKYKIPEGSEPFFRPYVQSGSKFFVARVDATKVNKGSAPSAPEANTMLSPLRFHYDTEQFSLPVRLGLVNSKGTQDLIVHILAKNQRYEVANYPNVTIPTNLDVSEKARGEFGSFYASLYDTTLAKNPKAVVTEYSWDASTCDPCPGPALSPSDLATLGSDVTEANPTVGSQPTPPGKPGATPPPRPPPRRWSNPSYTLTRLHARYTREALGDDLVFRAAGPIVGGRELYQAPSEPSKDGKPSRTLEHGSRPDSHNNFQGRYAIRHPWTGPVECKEPRYGVWGGPPAGHKPPPDPNGQAPDLSPKPAKNLAFVPRDAPLAAFMRSEIPELNVKPEGAAVPGAGPIPTASSSASPATRASNNADGGASPGNRPGACGCDVVGTSSGPGPLAAVSALLYCAFGVVRRRRRPSNPRESHKFSTERGGADS